MYWKDENKEKEAGNGPFFFKKNYCLSLPSSHATYRGCVGPPFAPDDVVEMASFVQHTWDYAMVC